MLISDYHPTIPVFMRGYTHTVIHKWHTGSLYWSRPDTLLRGIIENVSSPIEEISPRGSVTSYCLVRFRGSKVVQTSTSGLGLGIEVGLGCG